MNYRFYNLHSEQNTVQPPENIPPYTVVWWHPTWRQPRPAGLTGKSFLVWWFMHICHLFANRNYALLLLYDSERLIHRSCVFPRYFRFPFMAKPDVQIGDTWTDSAYRGQGIAVYALRTIVALCQRDWCTLWYIVDEDNTASIRVAEKAGFSLAGRGVRTKRCGLHALGEYTLTTGPGVNLHGVYGVYPAIKRLGDFFVSLISLLVLSPILLGIALWIKITSPGSVLYRGRRVGKDGRIFHILKFRTMVVNTEQIGGASTAGDDPCITRPGKLLR